MLSHFRQAVTFLTGSHIVIGLLAHWVHIYTICLVNIAIITAATTITTMATGLSGMNINQAASCGQATASAQCTPGGKKIRC